MSDLISTVVEAIEAAIAAHDWNTEQGCDDEDLFGRDAEEMIADEINDGQKQFGLLVGHGQGDGYFELVGTFTIVDDNTLSFHSEDTGEDTEFKVDDIPSALASLQNVAFEVDSDARVPTAPGFTDDGEDEDDNSRSADFNDFELMLTTRD